MKNEVLRIERVTQIVDDVTLLDNFNLHIFAGEVMGLVCINDHGQEALVELICKNVPLHYGQVFLAEQRVNSYQRSEMTTNRVALIESKGRLVESLTVADNIFVLRKGFKKYFISPKVLAAQLRQFTEPLQIEMDPNQPVSQLGSAQRCVVELLRALVMGTKLVILRDVNNFIGTTDLKKIHSLLRHLAKQGMSFLYICNHHEEAYEICDRISLMENGRVRKVLRKKDFKEETMQPYTLDFCRIPAVHPVPKAKEEGMLVFQNIYTNHLQNMSFTVEKGECVVLLDMDNTTVKDLMALLSNDLCPNFGKILLDGKPLQGHAASRRGKLGFISENPTQTMLFQEKSYLDNLCFMVDQKRPHIRLRRSVRRSIEREYRSMVGDAIDAQELSDLPLASLYDLVYCRMHLYRPDVVVCVQPFSGADMYLRHHVSAWLKHLLDSNITVLILAVSLADSLVVADRLLVIEQGQVRRQYQSEEFEAVAKKRYTYI